MALFCSRSLASKAILKLSGCQLTAPTGSSKLIRHSSHFTFVPESPDPSHGKANYVSILQKTLNDITVNTKREKGVFHILLQWMDGFHF
jgi:hypothetical protein